MAQESDMCLVEIESGEGRQAWGKEGFPEKIMPDWKPYEAVTFYRKEERVTNELRKEMSRNLLI